VALNDFRRERRQAALVVWLRFEEKRMLGSRTSFGRILALVTYFSFVSMASRAQPLPPPVIAYQSRTVLIAGEAEVVGTAKLINMGPGKMGWVQSWGNADDLITWHIKVQRTAITKFPQSLNAVIQTAR
jgi:hypothetical protein